MIKWDLSQECKDFSIATSKSVSMIYHINKLKSKNHMIISTDSEKAFDKIEYSFILRTVQNVGIEGSYLNIIKAVHDKPKTNIILNGKIVKAFPLRSGARHRCPSFPLLFDIALDVLAIEI